MKKNERYRLYEVNKDMKKSGRYPVERGVHDRVWIQEVGKYEMLHVVLFSIIFSII